MTPTWAGARARRLLSACACVLGGLAIASPAAAQSPQLPVLSQVQLPQLQAPQLPGLPELPGAGPVNDVSRGVTDGVNDAVQGSPVGGGNSNSSTPGGGPGGGIVSTGGSGGDSSGAGSSGSGGGGGGGLSLGAADPSGASGDGSATPAERRATRRRARARARRVAARRDARLRARARARREAGGDKGNGKDGGVVPQPIRDIVEVVPGPIKLLLGVLGALAVAFFIRSVFASARARRLDQERKRLLEDVGVLQGALLPDVPPRFGSLTTSVGYRPAEGPAAGGDFYDVFETDSGRVGIIVGDVCGHGRDALAVTALMRYSLRAYLNAGLGPRTALRLAAHSLEKDQDTALTTVVLAEYDSRAGTLSYACAGHEPPILLGPASGKHVTASSSPPVGAGLTTGLRETTLAFPPGSSACFFTDGLVEARKGSKMIGRGELTRIVAGLEPGSSAHVLLERLAGVADRAPDDMAACLIRAEDGAVAPTVERIEELELGPADLTAEVGEKFLAGCGVPARSAAEAVASARTTAAEFGSAILRVTLDGDTGRVKVLPHDPAVAPLTVGAAVNGGPPLTVPTELSA